MRLTKLIASLLLKQFHSHYLFLFNGFNLNSFFFFHNGWSKKKNSHFKKSIYDIHIIASILFLSFTPVKMGRGCLGGGNLLPCHYGGLWKIPRALVAFVCKYGALCARCLVAELAITTLTLLEMTSPCTSHLPPVAMTTHHPDHTPYHPKVWAPYQPFTSLYVLFPFMSLFIVFLANCPSSDAFPNWLSGVQEKYEEMGNFCGRSLREGFNWA